MIRRQKNTRVTPIHVAKKQKAPCKPQKRTKVSRAKLQSPSSRRHSHSNSNSNNLDKPSAPHFLSSFKHHLPHFNRSPGQFKHQTPKSVVILENDLEKDSTPSWNPPWFPRKKKSDDLPKIPPVEYPYPEGSGQQIPSGIEIEIEGGGQSGVLGRVGGSNSGIQREAESGDVEPWTPNPTGISIPVSFYQAAV